MDNEDIYNSPVVQKLLWTLNTISEEHDIDLQEYYRRYEKLKN